MATYTAFLLLVRFPYPLPFPLVHLSFRSGADGYDAMVSPNAFRLRWCILPSTALAQLHRFNRTQCTFGNYHPHDDDYSQLTMN